MAFYEIFIRLLFVHILSDFYLQSEHFCSNKLKNGLKGKELYLHSVTVFILSWLSLCSLNAWWIALIVGVTHLIIDSLKCLLKRDNLYVFLTDQLLHISIIAFVAYLCLEKWNFRVLLTDSIIFLNYSTILLAFILCGKPTNILTKYILELYHIEKLSDNNRKFHAGALIGSLERYLILIFMLLEHYEVIGFLLAAKSLIRFKDNETLKTEYVLSGTLISVTMAVMYAMLIRIIL